MIDDIVVRLQRLPMTVHGYTVISPDGWVNIYINDRLSFVEMRKTYRHELRHLKRNDMECARDFAEVERD